MADDEDVPLKDLLKPLSAKVMPQRARMTLNGKMRSDTEMLAHQRKEAAEKFKLMQKMRRKNAGK